MANVVLSGSSRFNVIDLAQLGRMYVLEDLDSESTIAARMVRFKEIWTEHDPPSGAQYDVENLEFDPIRITQELNTYFEDMLRDRVNQAARAVTLAFAIGTDLDAIASKYPVGGRLPIVAEPSGTALEYPEDYESDERYRRRVQLSLNPTSPHGPSGAYMFWALTADANLRDATEVAKEGKGEIILTVMDDSPPVKVQTGDSSWEFTTEPRPSHERTLAIRTYVHEAYRKAATDVLTVVPPQVIDTRYVINVWFYPPPDKATLLARIGAKLEELIEEQRYLGYDHTRMAIFAALKQDGVHRSEITEPAADIFVTPRQCVRVTEVVINYIGRGE